jgi:hypothetical protein
VNSLKPTGISGGALIDLGNLADLDRLAEPGSAGRLVGLLIEHRTRHKAMVAMRMTTIIRAINEIASGRRNPRSGQLSTDGGGVPMNRGTLC